MTTIKSLLQEAWNNYNSFKNKYNDKSFDEEFGKVMKEYADYQVEKFKKNLINCAYYQENSHVVDVSLILGIDLPEHE